MTTSNKSNTDEKLNSINQSSGGQSPGTTGSGQSTFDMTQTPEKTDEEISAENPEGSETGSGSTGTGGQSGANTST